MSVLSRLKFVTDHPLNRQHKIKSLIRFAKWQIGSRLVPGAVVFDWIDGAKFLVRNGETGLTGNVYTGLHEFADMAFLLHVLRAEDLFIDAGANLGSYTILACSSVGANAYTIEPVPGTFEKLTANIRLNQLETKVECLNVALGREAATMNITSDLDTTNHLLAKGEHCENTTSVDVSTLDAILGSEHPTLMKIDVEGYETPVLEGAQETLRKESLQAVIMELNGSGERYGFDETHTMEMMLDHGFKTYSYDPMDRTLVNLQNKNLQSGNTIFIRDEAFVIDRLKSSPKYKVHDKHL
jgi:FkbM family methyltransferase